MTLHDVAAAAGVSKSTVSRILDERLPRSESETARRVRQVAAGWATDVSAASLRRGKTMTIGVVVPRLTDTVMAMLYEALAHACRRSGQFAIVATTDDEPQAERAAAEARCTARSMGWCCPPPAQATSSRSWLHGVPYVLALRTTVKSGLGR